jgi:hypothetical protein
VEGADVTTVHWIRLAVVVLGLAIWYSTQALLKHRPSGTGQLGDGLHSLTRSVFQFLTANPKSADMLLILSSLVIDLLGLFVLWQSIFGPSIRPFIGLIIVFLARQICQAFCALPPPEGMIWRNPGFPTLLVTYGVSNDLFFSGHTALAVYGAIELGHWGGGAWAVVGAAIVVFEIAAVIVLRAHYTMDVFAGAVAAYAAWIVAERWSPAWDDAIQRLAVWLIG